MLELVALGLVSAGDKVFQMSISTYRRHYSLEREGVGLEPSGKVHELRHSGVAADIEQQDVVQSEERKQAVGSRIKDREGTRRRGRWALLKSLAVYDKPHLLVRSRARFSDEFLKHGRWLMSHGELIADQWISRVREDIERKPSTFMKGRSRPGTKDEYRTLRCD